MQRLETFEPVHLSFTEYYNSRSTGQDEFYLGNNRLHYAAIISG